MAGIMDMDMDMVNALLGRNPSTVMHEASQPKEYPTSDDVAFARKQDYSYGQPWAPYFEGKQTNLLTGSPNAQPWQTTNTPWSPPGGEDYYAKAALAAQNSGLASLGFDPTKSAADYDMDPKKVNILGMYRHKNDQIYANARDPSAIVHESIHRGIQKLKESPYWKDSFNDVGNVANEDAVRWLMEKKMGNPEGENSGPAGERQRNSARYWFENSTKSRDYRKALDEMEMAASQYMAAKRPGGPR